MEHTPARRDVLALAGTGTALSLAGCASLGGDGDALADADGAEADTAGDGVVLVAEPSEEDLEAMQSKLFEEVEAGEIAEEEAQMVMQERQMELTVEVVQGLIDTLEDEPLDVEESEPEYGLVLVAGSPADKLAALHRTEVSAILHGDDFAEFQEQLQEQEDQP